MKNFIVPVDFSKDSLKGIDMALLFSHKQPVNIQMVYVQKSSDDFRPGSFEEEFRFAEIQMKKLISEYEQKLGNDSRIRFIIKKGSIYKEVVNQAESYKDVIISASTHGASGFEEFFVGSNTYKILSATDTPVLTIRKSECPADFKRIVVPMKMHVDSRQKVPFAADLAELFGAEIHLISITTSNNKRNLDRLDAYLNQSSNYFRRRRIDHTVKKLYGDNLVSMTTNYASAINADLVIIINEKGGGWNALMGNYPHEMINACPVPVLSLKAKEKHFPSGFRTSGG